jgi:bacillithiol system protein YtxJ
MGLFNSVFGGSNKEKESTEKKSGFQWLELKEITQIAQIKEESKVNPVIIYKHSTRCGISKMVIRQFERLFTEEHKNFKVYYLDLLNHRDISNELASVFEVFHQSPQVLVIKNGTCVFNTSHEAIIELDLTRFV